jgi:arabinogalactan oligomer/maltooligosaccharide transport system permease protein
MTTQADTRSQLQVGSLAQENLRVQQISRRNRQLLIDIVTHGILIAFVIFALFPIYWVLSASFKPREEIFSTELYLFPQHFTFDNYVHVTTVSTKISTKDGSLQDTNLFLRWLLNSIIVAGNTTLIGVIFAATASYALSRFKFLGRGGVLAAFLITQMFPGAILIIPLYNLLNQFGLLNNWFGLVLAYCTIALPFSVWMLKGFFDTIPYDLEEAATVDGTSPFGAFWRIILPLTLPGIAVVAFFNFMTAWNEFLLAFTFMSTDVNYTLPVGLRTFISQFDAQWQYMAACAVIITVPVLIGFFFTQKYLVSGLTSGSVKG